MPSSEPHQRCYDLVTSSEGMELLLDTELSTICSLPITKLTEEIGLLSPTPNPHLSATFFIMFL